MNRILMFHHHGASGVEVRMAPSAYYMDGDYEKVAVRLYAGTAPLYDAEFDIFDDDVSIFVRNRITSTGITSGRVTVLSDKTTVSLIKGESSDEIAESFNADPIASGSWVHCNLVIGGGGYDFTVLLELRPLSEDDEGED